MKKASIRLLTQKERDVRLCKQTVHHLLATIDQLESELQVLKMAIKDCKNGASRAQADLDEAENRPEEGGPEIDEENAIGQAFMFIEHAWSRMVAAHADARTYRCDGGMWNMINDWLKPAVEHWNQTITGEYDNPEKQRFVDLAIDIVAKNQPNGCFKWLQEEWTPAFRLYQKTTKPIYYNYNP